MRYLITFLLLTLSTAVFALDYVYKRVNPDGTVEYSDKKLEGGNVIKVPKGSTFTTSPGSEQAAEQNTSNNNEPEKISYKLSIVSPLDDQPVRSNNGNIDFRASLEPNSFPKGYKLIWTMDEAVIPGAESLVVKMQNVDRGTHELQVSIVDDKGNTITSSETVTFHLLRIAGG